MTEYNLIRSSRKTIAIYITGDATVEVRAPLWVPKHEIDRFVASRQGWINKNLAIRQHFFQNKTAFQLNYGDMVLLQGRAYPITAGNSSRAAFDGTSFVIPSGLTAGEIKGAVVRIYRDIAKKLLLHKVLAYAKQMGVMPSAVKVNGAKSRWGSCSGKNSLNFSWRLVMAEDDVVDYVVVHELAHIIEHNHSSGFWAIVANRMPGYKQQQAKLNQLQKRLANEDWD